ncbi:MAG: cupin domain-containing protein [Nitrospirales bacterium]
MRIFSCFVTAVLIAITLVVPLWAESLSVYQDRIETKDINRILSENSLSPDENIRSTFLHKTEHASIHLIQIRFKEKPHIHKTHDLLVILKRGKGVLHIGGETVQMKKGDSVLIPQGVVHFFENITDEVAVGLGIFNPPYDGTDMVPVESP